MFLCVLHACAGCSDYHEVDGNRPIEASGSFSKVNKKIYSLLHNTYLQKSSCWTHSRDLNVFPDLCLLMRNTPGFTIQSSAGLWVQTHPAEGILRGSAQTPVTQRSALELTFEWRDLLQWDEGGDPWAPFKPTNKHWGFHHNRGCRRYFALTCCIRLRHRKH